MTSITFTFRPSTASVTPTPGAPVSVTPTPAAPAPSFKASGGTGIPIEQLKPDNNDTYDLTQVQRSRKIQLPIKVTNGQKLPPISQVLPFDGTLDESLQSGKLSLEYSLQWFSLASTEQDEKGGVAITLRVVPGKTTASGKVVKVAYYSMAGGQEVGRQSTIISLNDGQHPASRMILEFFTVAIALATNPSSRQA
ncbi:MAG: hypothetical protein Q9195_006490 [Heterodermia aff. obscurata]